MELNCFFCRKRYSQKKCYTRRLILFAFCHMISGKISTKVHVLWLSIFNLYHNILIISSWQNLTISCIFPMANFNFNFNEYVLKAIKCIKIINNVRTIKLFFTILKSHSHLPKKLCYLLDWKPFKSDENCFLFHLKMSFLSQDI